MTAKELSRGRQQLDLTEYLRALEQAVCPGSSCGLSEIRSCLHAVAAHISPLCQDNPPNVTDGQDPRLEHAVEHLAAEETQLLCSLQVLIAKTQCQSLPAVNDAFCETVRDWIHRFRRHCECNTDLIQDAWNQDLGMGD